MSLKFVTSNDHKFVEAEKIAGEHGLEIDRVDASYVEIQADTLREVVEASAESALGLAGGSCFVEDAGLFIDILDGFPGPYSSYVFKTIGNQGVLSLMEGVKDKRAEFRSAVGYCEPGSEPRVFEGRVRGSITKDERGGSGFGYDPIFMLEGGERGTFAELSTEEKNSFSHRGEAIEKFVKWYVSNKMVEGD